MSDTLKGKEVSNPRFNSELAAAGFWLAVAENCYGSSPGRTDWIAPYLRDGVRVAQTIPEAERKAVFAATQRSPVLWVGRQFANLMVNLVRQKIEPDGEADMRGLRGVKQREFAAALEMIRREAGNRRAPPGQETGLPPLIAFK